jgi:copper chaperone NosL
MKRLSNLSRALLAVSSLGVVACFFLPLWEIKLWAPQYPEGLAMQIWHDRLGGDVDVINGLNHYIGMKHLKAEMFPEFTFLKYLIGAFIGLGLLVAFLGTLRWLKIYVVIILLGAVVALADFYRWGYDYGHNLDPTAPIQVPGMGYQPPVIGYKVLLNFTALSIPASGGWVFVGVGALALALLAWETLQLRASKKLAAGAVAALGLLWLSGCGPQELTLNYGKDQCHHCKMTLVDNRYGAALRTDKGKVYKFDDVNCLVDFLHSGKLPQAEVAEISFANFAQPNTLVPQEQAWFLHSDSLNTPMASGVAVFGSEAELQKAQATYPGRQWTWQQLYDREERMTHGHHGH